jgi:hypothetical protein
MLTSASGRDATPFHRPRRHTRETSGYIVSVCFCLTNFCFVLYIVRRLYCFPSESGLRSNKMQSHTSWCSHHWVVNWLHHSGSYTLPFGFDDIPNVCATLGENIVGFRFEEAKDKATATCLERILRYGELKGCCHTRNDEILIRGPVTWIEFSCRDSGANCLPPASISHGH